ncbi:MULTISPECIES: hypothetical protein [Vibrio]|uniref:hypothetical protein n=1 Tax=Vibrio TaxID=662 RepID=UPI00215E7BBE|nr:MULTISPECIES: hypothetical protein [Vibrio]EGQ8195815.1 hypothetical protein [Vibrio parahaemolyticus]EHE7897966.1 hypothetical protein [Vibrio parahaemolyticus]MCS0263407.1 hypothetical protein [Vibrio alginolyticus]MDF4280517.1 hypothetical protein [Vibrio parahaemolyticus]MDG2550247.1 hypothetical protein [Vibrio parahaemolyticus]
MQIETLRNLQGAEFDRLALNLETALAEIHNGKTDGFESVVTVIGKPLFAIREHFNVLKALLWFISQPTAERETTLRQELINAI